MLEHRWPSAPSIRRSSSQWLSSASSSSCDARNKCPAWSSSSPTCSFASRFARARAPAPHPHPHPHPHSLPLELHAPLSLSLSLSLSRSARASHLDRWILSSLSCVCVAFTSTVELQLHLQAQQAEREKNERDREHKALDELEEQKGSFEERCVQAESELEQRNNELQRVWPPTCLPMPTCLLLALAVARVTCIAARSSTLPCPAALRW